MSGYRWDPPAHLDIPGRPELRLFPERIILFDSPAPVFVRQAVYVPDIESFRPRPEWDPETIPGELELYDMVYISVNDLNAEIMFTASLLGGYRMALKRFRGQAANSVSGWEPWDEFFLKAAGLTIPSDEKTLVIARRAQDGSRP
jgi:hypothetical protein